MHGTLRVDQPLAFWGPTLKAPSPITQQQPVFLNVGDAEIVIFIRHFVHFVHFVSLKCLSSPLVSSPPFVSAWAVFCSAPLNPNATRKPRGVGMVPARHELPVERTLVQPVGAASR